MTATSLMDPFLQGMPNAGMFPDASSIGAPKPAENTNVLSTISPSTFTISLILDSTKFIFCFKELLIINILFYFF